MEAVTDPTTEGYKGEGDHVFKALDTALVTKQTPLSGRSAAAVAVLGCGWCPLLLGSTTTRAGVFSCVQVWPGMGQMCSIK